MWFLVRIYLPICAAILGGAIASFILNRPAVQQRLGAAWAQRSPVILGRFLFFLGVPAGIIHFLRQADLSSGVVLAPLVAWAAMLGALFCSWLWLQFRTTHWSRPAIGAFSLASTLGNTGYIGYPIVLLLPQLGPNYFGWALFYDILGTLFGAYGLGVLIASRFGGRYGETRSPLSWLSSCREIARTPAILAFFLGLLLRPVPFPLWLEGIFAGFAWSGVLLSLVLIGAPATVAFLGSGCARTGISEYSDAANSPGDRAGAHPVWPGGAASSGAGVAGRDAFGVCLYCAGRNL